MREREIFIEALGLDDTAARDDFIHATCGGDAKLTDRVQALLAAHEKAHTFLTHGEDATQAQPDTYNAMAGLTIDRYKLLEQIGEGGFGVVYMADQQTPVRRRVALKIMKPGMSSQQVVARFEAERQALAMMDHPNIARVLDAGATDGGRPYFVMELVNGQPIIEFCDKRKLDTDERLALFCQVCRAIQHAHVKGIIHRDIKPSNVLVTMHDTEAVPKVIDFGIAKAISHRLTEKTLFTRFGQMIGTPQYMSPEQSEMNDLDVDTRTDIYSLGVLLYELLTGQTPLDLERLQAGGLMEMLRIIREEEPPMPSSRFGAINQTTTSVCKRRNTEPSRLGKRLRGDLDWIVMKALEKDRTRRYETPSALADDVHRHLTGGTVTAGRPTAAYRLLKFVRRNRSVVLATGAVVAALVVGLAVSLLGLSEAIRQSQRATAAATSEANAAAKLRQTLDLIVEMFRSVDPTEGAGPEYTTHEWLNEFSSRLDQRLADQPPEVQAEVRQTIGMAYLRLNLQYSAQPHLIAAAKNFREAYGSSNHRKTADCLVDLAMSNVLLCRPARARQCADEAMSIYGQLGIENELSGRAEEVLRMATWDEQLYELVDTQHRNFRHEAVAKQVDELLRESQMRPVGVLLGKIFFLKLDVGDFEGAKSLALGRINEGLGAVDRSLLRHMTRQMGNFYLAYLYQFYDMQPEAEAIFLSMKDDAMQYQVREDGWMQMMYAWGLLHCGECGEAELQRALELAESFARPLEDFRAMSQLRFFAHHTLAAAYARVGNLPEAIVAERTALSTIHPQHLFIRGLGERTLASLLSRHSQHDEAERVLSDGVRWRNENLSEQSLQRAAGEMNLAEHYLEHRRSQEHARALLDQAAERIKHRHEDDFYRVRLNRLRQMSF